ncbi:uncharacterized protein LOC112554686 isoform X2 [Pomacea canaliculata]|uniref:uncharacterized protein LOC112554686 isoform X2 n=1 Tax=Pomacea canaliculata TaxID=400727 RepID=UPI000D727D65|nr:uncharacterized protein LOC112554686 isoform X2 [Pomacea canaliculata]
MYIHPPVRTTTPTNRNIIGLPWFPAGHLCCSPSSVSLATSVSAAVFYRQGLRERINLCLFALAIVDLVVVLAICAVYCELLYREVIGPSWVIKPYAGCLTGSVWASHFLSAVIASERCFCVVSPFHAKRLLKTSTMAAIIVVGSTLLIGGMCAIVAPKHISVCRVDPLTNITEDIVYVTIFYLKNKAIVDAFDIFVYATALPGIFLVVIIVATVITSIKLRAALAWRHSSVSKATTVTTTSPEGQGGLKMSHKEVGVTRMLMATSVLFIVCITPNVILQVTTLVVSDFSYTGRYYNLIDASWGIVNCFWMISSSFTFFVYLKMGSKFRDTVSNMLCNKKG